MLLLFTYAYRKTPFERQWIGLTNEAFLSLDFMFAYKKILLTQVRHYCTDRTSNIDCNCWLTVNSLPFQIVHSAQGLKQTILALFANRGFSIRKQKLEYNEVDLF